MLLLIELSRLRIESFSFSFPFSSYHIMGSWVGIRVMVRELFPIFFASPEKYIVAIVTWSSKQKGKGPTSTVPCPRGLRPLAFRIPLNGYGSATQMRLESPGETFGSRTGNLSPQQAPQFDPVRHAVLKR